MLFFNAGESGKVTRNPYPEAHLTKSSNSPPPLATPLDNGVLA